MPKMTLELIAACFTFAGSLVLCLDALRVRRTLKQRRGAETLVEVIKKLGQEGLLQDSGGRVLDSPKTIEDWFAARSFRMAWVGFMLLSSGFALDLYSKLVNSLS
jgi:hypothetical protein